MKTLLSTFILLLTAYTLYAQDNVLRNQQAQEPAVIPSIYLGGPRVGFTFLASDAPITNPLNGEEINPFITQFGWQLETRYFTLDNGTAGLIEFVGLIGGLEQNLFLPSITALIGIRNARGLEFGFGPNLSISGAAFAFAFGANFQSQNINFPINIAFVPGRDVNRISLLFGFNARKSSGPSLGL
jgi:hypothetical protein